jgi:hypothetical protein
MRSATYHGGGVGGKGPYGGGATATAKIYASLEANSGYSIANRVSGSNGALTGAGGTFSVYKNVGVTYSGSPVGEFTIVTPGDYRITAGGTIRSGTSNWIIRMGLQVNSGTIHATKISGNVASNYCFTSESIILGLVANDKVHLAYSCDYMGASATVDFEEGYLTLDKVS